jgi:hypothetical protein
MGVSTITPKVDKEPSSSKMKQAEIPACYIPDIETYYQNVLPVFF